MKRLMIRGILPATITPLDEKGRFAPAIFEQLLDRLYAAGVHGIYVCGTTGEGMLMAAAQRKAIVETAVACTPSDRHIIVHVGAASVDEAVLLSAHAAHVGAHAVSSLPPLAGQFAFSEVLRYYETLARASELPLLVYHFPDVSASIATAEQLDALCALPNVFGVKFTDYDLYKMSLMTHASRSVFNGRDEVLAAGLLMGANGGIGSFYNLLPELFVRIYTAAMSGDWEQARLVQQRANVFIRITLQFPLFPAVKQILTWSGLDCGACLPPRAPLSAEQQALLRRDLVDAGFGDLIAHAVRS